MNKQEEATLALREIVQQLTSPNRDIKLILRKCQHVCDLLNWPEPKKWFTQELNGYASTTDLPPHRRIEGNLEWRFDGSIFDNVSWKTEESMYGLDPDIYDTEEDTLLVWSDISWIVGRSNTGYVEETGETKMAPARSRSREFKLKRVRVFPAWAFARSFSKIEQFVFDWASQTYVQIAYGAKIETIWQEFRTLTDAAIQEIGLYDHLSAIHDSLGSDNPEAWRAAVLECRNILNDVANYLWQDPRPTYDLLPGSGESKFLEVKQGSYSNRMSAYLHQKAITGGTGKYIREEIEWLATLIRNLISLQSSAHEPIERKDADSAAIGTYLVLGEIARRTDLKPITEYQEINAS